jgi:8-oxo-dGTP diphosphatase
VIRPENVPVAVDCIVEIADGSKLVLIERKNPPYGCAIPGGFLEAGETVADAARRELKEETGLEVTLHYLLGVYSKPGRDPRGPVVSVTLVGSSDGWPVAGDDAAKIFILDLNHHPIPPMAFDHEDVLRDYLNYRNVNKRPPLDR